MMDDVPLDEVYRDRITGFTGTATAKTEFLSGTKKVCLERGSATCNSEEMWVDFKRIEPAGSEQPVGF